MALVVKSISRILPCNHNLSKNYYYFFVIIVVVIYKKLGELPNNRIRGKWVPDPKETDLQVHLLVECPEAFKTDNKKY